VVKVATERQKLKIFCDTATHATNSGQNVKTVAEVRSGAEFSPKLRNFIFLKLESPASHFVGMITEFEVATPNRELW
jgi:hypothetical protein